jgi:hypothetical protein
MLNAVEEVKGVGVLGRERVCVPSLFFSRFRMNAVARCWPQRTRRAQKREDLHEQARIQLSIHAHMCVGRWVCVCARAHTHLSFLISSTSLFVFVYGSPSLKLPSFFFLDKEVGRERGGAFFFFKLRLALTLALLLSGMLVWVGFATSLPFTCFFLLFCE